MVISGVVKSHLQLFTLKHPSVQLCSSWQTSSHRSGCGHISALSHHHFWLPHSRGLLPQGDSSEHSVLPCYPQQLMQSSKYQARLIFHATTLGSEATGADEGECFTREAVTEMIVTSLKWKQALGFQKDGLSTSALT